MLRQIARSAALVVLTTAPLLAGCGGPSAPTESSPAPASAPTAGSAQDLDAAASSTPAPAVDAQQRKQVQAATEKFVRTTLTIGYPDRAFEEYTARIEPLMTEEGFASLESAESTRQGSTALTSLYAQRARSAPKLSGDPEVVSIEATRATVQLDYENVAQQRSGSSWKTLKSLGRGSVTVKLVLVDGEWLIDDAS